MRLSQVLGKQMLETGNCLAGNGGCNNYTALLAYCKGLEFSIENLGKLGEKILNKPEMGDDDE